MRLASGGTKIFPADASPTVPPKGSVPPRKIGLFDERSCSPQDTPEQKLWTFPGHDQTGASDHPTGGRSEIPLIDLGRFWISRPSCAKDVGFWHLADTQYR